jgi:hypothetical protein
MQGGKRGQMLATAEADLEPDRAASVFEQLGWIERGRRHWERDRQAGQA